MFIRNAWYVGAWDHEIGREMKRRIILNEPIVFFRRDDGVPVALEDRCAHRQVPLSLGKLKGNVVECPYHGMQFDQTGCATHIPTQGMIPPAAKVRAYPVVERNHWVWIWMGDPAMADPALIEDFHWIGDPAWQFAGDVLHVKGNYLLLVDNLLDTTHLTYIHPTTLGTDDFSESEFEVVREQNSVKATRWLMNRAPAPFHKRMGGFADGALVDRWQVITFSPPCFVKLDVGSAIANTGARQGDRSQGITMMNLNAITPETETTSHYFWAQPYNFKQDQRWIRDLVHQQVTRAFGEDLAIINAQQANIDLADGPTVDLGQDAGGLHARRIVARMLKEEQAEAGRAAAE